nr:MAG TPA: hypothetical protein [Caudoviricetes sp.]
MILLSLLWCSVYVRIHPNSEVFKHKLRNSAS